MCIWPLLSLRTDGDVPDMEESSSFFGHPTAYFYVVEVELVSLVVGSIQCLWMELWL